jgi:hemerythrin
LGGDEFLIICAGTPIEGAVLLAETIRAAVAALRVPAGTGEWRGSISVGVAARTAAMKGFDDLLQAADQGLYAAKRNGRNCVAIADANKNARGADFPLDTEGRVMPSHVRRPLELMPDAIQFASRPH